MSKSKLLQKFIFKVRVCLKDVIIIGAGPAGLTTALYAARAGFSVLILEKSVCGGQVATTGEVENYPAIENISGADFSMNLYNQVISKNVEVLFEEVKRVDFSDKIKKVFTDFNGYEAKTVIIANGVKRRELGCKGEKEFSGRGVSYCATCDGAFFKDKDVAVVGAGNTALEDALFLSNICNSLTILIRNDKIRGERILFEAVQDKSNIALKLNSTISEIGGKSGSVSFVRVFDKILKKEIKLNVSAVFVAIGLMPDNNIFSNFIKLDESGYILSDESCITNVSGVFVAGDTRKKSLRQIVTAEADGAAAAANVSKYLN